MSTKLEIGKTVKFSYRGKRLSGVVTRIGLDTVNIKVGSDPAEYQILKHQVKA